jgi:hypothetical protein
MTVMALDWNATRVRGVLGLAGEYPLPLPLEPPNLDLPLFVNQVNGTPAVGSRGLHLCRNSAHQVCHTFLPYLTPHEGKGPSWQIGRQTFDARQANLLVWKKLQSFAGKSQGVLLTVPGYLQPAQAETLQHLGHHTGLPVLGSAPTTLTAALAGHSEQFWQKSVLVIDVDDYSLTLGLVKAMSEKAHLIESRSFAHLGLRFWKDRLINALAEQFIWQHRRDPRDSPLAEQSLYDQLDVLMDASLQHRAIQLGVQSQQWFKHLLVHPEQTALFCQPLIRQVVAETDHLRRCWPAEAMPRGILLTHAAGQLPGLVEALQELVRTPPRPDNALAAKQSFNADEEDFGDELLFHDVEELAGVLTLPPEAPARAAHGLAELFRKSTLPRGHLESIVPLPLPQPMDTGPARLHFQGRDYLLRETSFFLGSQFGCQLHFERLEHPEVAAQHCEIVYDHRAFVLHNRSREGTLVNDRLLAGSVGLHAGDRIRLGAHGPVVRFLGRSLPRSVNNEQWPVISG